MSYMMRFTIKKLTASEQRSLLSEPRVRRERFMEDREKETWQCTSLLRCFTLYY